jgi:hypothetical protein
MRDTACVLEAKNSLAVRSARPRKFESTPDVQQHTTPVLRKNECLAKQPPSPSDIRDASRPESAARRRDSRWADSDGVGWPEFWLGVAPEFQALRLSEGDRDCNG